MLAIAVIVVVGCYVIFCRLQNVIVDDMWLFVVPFLQQKSGFIVTVPGDLFIVIVVIVVRLLLLLLY
jgi:hypothetical protein